MPGFQHQISLKVFFCTAFLRNSWNWAQKVDKWNNAQKEIWKIFSPRLLVCILLADLDERGLQFGKFGNPWCVWEKSARKAAEHWSMGVRLLSRIAWLYFSWSLMLDKPLLLLTKGFYFISSWCHIVSIKSQCMNTFYLWDCWKLSVWNRMVLFGAVDWVFWRTLQISTL